MKRYILFFVIILGLSAPGSRAQQPSEPPRPSGGPPPLGPARPPMERALGGPPGRWWNNPDMVQKLSLTADQQRKMDDIFQQSRLKLIDLNAALQKDEVILEPLMAADQPDEGKILGQIDRIAQGRAELEKANARMLLGIRRVLSADQWKTLSAETPPPPPRGDGPGRPAPPPGRGGGPPPPPPPPAD
jgi:protein CpxP